MQKDWQATMSADMLLYLIAFILQAALLGIIMYQVPAHY